MTILLIIAAVLFGLPAWLPLMSGHEVSAELRQSSLLFAGDTLLAILFIILVGEGVFTIDYSVRFAAAGIPLA